jgi:hypothetical protein
VDSAAARGERRVEQVHVGVGEPRREALVIVARRQLLFVALHAEVPDARIGQQAQEALDHPEPRAQHRHDQPTFSLLETAPAAGRAAVAPVVRRIPQAGSTDAAAARTDDDLGQGRRTVNERPG